MATRKSPEEAVSVFDSSERDLKFQRKLKVAENEAKLAKSRLAASEAEVESLKTRVDFLSNIQDTKPFKMRVIKRNRKNGGATAILMISDVHCEELVEPSKVNGLNEYNLKICESSLNQVFSRFVMLLNQERQLVDIREMVLWIGGDLASGAIHPELIEVAQLPVMHAFRWIQERLEGGIQYLLDNAGLDRIRIITSVGNHSRNTIKRMISTEIEHSYEYNMYKVMEAKTKDPRIEWQIEDGYLTYADVEGWITRWHHGSAIKCNGAIGGISTAITKAIRGWDQQIKADYSFSGHLHQFMFGKNFVCNGSMIGHSPFAIEIKCEFEDPSQTFCVIDRERGLTVVKKIFCRPPMGSNQQRTSRLSRRK